MADSKFLKFQDKNGDGMVDACDDLPITPAGKCGGGCLPNPNFLVPDWKTRTKDQPFLNEKVAKYQITIRTTYSSTIPERFLENENLVETEVDAQMAARFEEYLEEAIEWILSAYNKEESAATKDKLRAVAEYTTFFLDARPQSKLKLLYSFDCETFNSIPMADNDEDDDDEEDDTVSEVTYDMVDLRTKLGKVNKTLGLYNRYKRMTEFIEGINMRYLEGPAAGAVFDLKKYGMAYHGGSQVSVMRQLLIDLDNFLLDRDMNIPGSGPFKGLAKDRVRSIDFRFTKKYELKKMLVYTETCGQVPKKFGRSKLRTLTAKESWGDPTAVGYFARLDDMINDAEAREPKPWMEFIKEYTYPKVYSTSNQAYTNTDPEKTIGSCLADTLAEGGKQLGQDIFDEAFSIGDAIAYRFHKNVCSPTEEDARDQAAAMGLGIPMPPLAEEPVGQRMLQNQLIEMNAELLAVDDPSFDKAGYIKEQKQALRDAGKVVRRLGADRREWRQNLTGAAMMQAWEELQQDDPVIANMCMNVIMFLVPPVGGLRQGWNNTLGALRWCGLFNLLTRTVQCLFKGMTLEQALAGILESALTTMSIDNFGKLFVGLPPAKQAELDALVKKKIAEGDIFKEGSFNQEASNALAEMNAEPLTSVEKPWESQTLSEADKESTSISEATIALATGQPITSSEKYQETSTQRTLAQQFDGSSGDSLRNTVVMQAYMKAILEVYSDNLLDLMDELNKFPGAPLISQALMLMDCPRDPLFSPNWLEFMNSIDLPICRDKNRIKLPYLRMPDMKGWWAMLKDALRRAIIEAITAALFRILAALFKKICELIGGAACKALEVVGDAVEAAFSQNTFADLVKETICGEDVGSEQVESTILDLASGLGMGSAALADTEQTMNFFSDASTTSSAREWSLMFLGEPIPETIEAISNLAEDEYPELANAIGGPRGWADMFKGMGDAMPPAARANLLNIANASEADEVPANPSICATPERLEDWCQMRKDILAGRATPEQVERMCEEGRGVDDIVALSKIMNDPNNLFADMPPLMSAPGCDDGLIPFEDEDMIKTAQDLIDGDFELIQMAFSEDMLGNGPGERNWGMINMILADTMANPLTRHNRLSGNRRNYVDFTIGTDEVDSFDDPKFGNFSNVKRQRGAFPVKVAYWLQQNMLGEEGSLDTTFRSNNIPQDAKRYSSSMLDENGNFEVRDVMFLPDMGYNITLEPDFENDEFVLIEEARKMTPDVTLRYYDNNQGIGEGYDYGFSVKMYMSDIEKEDGIYKNVAGNNARIQIYETTPNLALADAIKQSVFLAPGIGAAAVMDKLAEKAAENAEYITELKYEFMAHDDDVFEELTQTAERWWEDYADFAACFEGQREHMPQLYLLKDLIVAGGASVDISSLKSQYDSFMSSVLNSFVEEVGNNDPAFNYGAEFDDLTYSSAEYVVKAGQTNSPGGTLYAEAEITDSDSGETRGLRNTDQILGVSRMEYEDPENNRIFYLDPAQYGGSYMRPPIYVKPIKNEGWLGFVDVLFPEMSGCKPRYTDLVDFQDIQDAVNSAYSSIPDDPRLKSDPKCVVELPYNRILERQSVGGIQGIIMAAIRIYASTRMIKSMATFTKFYPKFTETFSSSYASYIIEVMEKDFKDAQGAAWEFFNTFKDEEFWYAFLEQSVQMYARLVDSGEIEDPPEDVLKVLMELNNEQEAYYEGYPSTRQDLRDARKLDETDRLSLKNYREDLKFYAIFKTQEKAKRVLKELVVQELNTMGEKIVSNLEIVGMAPTVRDLDWYLLQNFTQGGEGLDLQKEIKEEVEGMPTESAEELYTSGGELYVITNVGDIPTEEGEEYVGYYHIHMDADGNPVWMAGEFHSDEPHSVLAPFASKVTLPIGDVPEYGTLSPSASTTQPFVIEKYISINGSRQSPSSAVATIKANEGDPIISEVYPGDMELVHDATTGAAVGVKGDLGVKYGLEFSYMNGSNKCVLTTVEVNALDLPVSQVDPFNGNSKMLYCLLLRLKEDAVFRLVSRYILSLNKMTSLVAIYNDMGFLSSINQTVWNPGESTFKDTTSNAKAGSYVVSVDEDSGLVTTAGNIGWQSPSNRASSPFVPPGLFNLKYDDWDQQLLLNTKTTIKRMFKTHYNMRDFDDEMDRMPSSATVLIKNLKGVLKPAAGQRLLPWWQKRLLRSNPFNKNDELCDT